MQAIILAAGMGRRLGKYTKDNTKCMLPVNGIRLIDRLLIQLSSLKLNRIIIVVGYKAQNLISYIQKQYDDKLAIEFVENPIYDKTNNIYSLSLAKKYLQEDDTILVESDLIFSDNLFKMVVASPTPNIALVAKYGPWMDGTVVQIDNENNILQFIPKEAFKHSEVDTYYKTVNIYKLSKEFSANKYIPFLEAYSRAFGNNEYYEQVLRILTMIGDTELKALPIDKEKWYEIDDIQDLNNAETIFANPKEIISRYTSRYGGYWRFPNILNFCYSSNPYFPPHNMIEEMKNSFSTLLREYPSGMCINTLLASRYFNIDQNYIVVGNGATELIKSIMEGFVGKVGVIYPTFEEYPHRLRDENIVRYSPTTKDFSYGIEELKLFFSLTPVKRLLVVNPDNPSGNYISKTDILSLANWCEEREMELVVDESFVDFTDDFMHNSLLDNNILKAHSNLIVVKSISKSYGVPGLRLGVIGSSNESLIKNIKKDVSIWNINSFAEMYLQIFGKYEKYYIKACELFIAERNRFFNDLSKIPYLRVFPSQTNYFLCELTAKFTSNELTQLLLYKYNILIKDCKTKTGLTHGNFIRIAIRDEKDNKTLSSILSSL